MSALPAALVFLLVAACSVQNTNSANEKAGAAMQQHAEEAGLQPEEGATLLVWESKGPELDFLKAVWVMKGHFDMIPKSLEEAVCIDDAGHAQTMLRSFCLARDYLCRPEQLHYPVHGFYPAADRVEII
ncbi:hypothetical protein ABU162_25335 [Paenibacillus thiaminolyticus]|uniref:hypothetical protein n=1 Tax=Paenibacillus thiaminolyticus TaxID=49283 RepID=UPI0035A5A1DF